MSVENPFEAMFPIGLGCSRLGSVLGASPEESVRLIRSAYEAGVRFYDTSDIYGQGESEWMLGRTLKGRDDVVLCTKIGKRLATSKRLLLPLKSLIRRFAGMSTSVRSGVRTARSKPMPTCWTPAYLRSALEKSLRNTGRERLDVLMLHSPSAEVIAAGEALDVLEAARKAGRIGMIGISIDDVAAAGAALADPRVRVLQVPLHPGDGSYDAILARANAAGVAIVAREVLGGPGAIGGGPLSRDVVAERIRRAVATPGVSFTLVGTTRVDHLLDGVRAIV